MSNKTHIYAELKPQIHEDLRTQHPEWIDPSINCPKCDDAVPNELSRQKN
jgi:hypothetical protein